MPVPLLLTKFLENICIDAQTFEENWENFKNFRISTKTFPLNTELFPTKENLNFFFPYKTDLNDNNTFVVPGEIRIGIGFSFQNSEFYLKIIFLPNNMCFLELESNCQLIFLTNLLLGLFSFFFESKQY